LGYNCHTLFILNRLTRQIICAILGLFLAVAVVWAVSNAPHLKPGPGYYLNLLRTYGPAIFIFWLITNFWPVEEEIEEVLNETPKTVPHVEGAVLDQSEDDPYHFSGSCSPHDARIVLARLEKEKIRFEIDAGTEMGKQMSFLGKQSISFTPIQIFIHIEDRAKADKIIAESGIEFGAL
jgi:hypothetical protein